MIKILSSTINLTYLQVILMKKFYVKSKKKRPNNQISRWFNRFKIFFNDGWKQVQTDVRPQQIYLIRIKWTFAFVRFPWALLILNLKQSIRVIKDFITFSKVESWNRSSTKHQKQFSARELSIHFTTTETGASSWLNIHRIDSEEKFSIVDLHFVSVFNLINVEILFFTNFYRIFFDQEHSDKNDFIPSECTD